MLDAYRKAHCSAQTIIEANAFPLKNVALQVSQNRLLKHIDMQNPKQRLLRSSQIDKLKYTSNPKPA